MNLVAGLRASTQYEFILQSRNNQAKPVLQFAVNPHVVRDRPDSQTWPLQGDYSTPITAFAETLSNFRATNVRAGDICVTQRSRGNGRRLFSAPGPLERGHGDILHTRIAGRQALTISWSEQS